jgi:[ribosomal protein S5]-alanine N-acetyltransferase
MLHERKPAMTLDALTEFPVLTTERLHLRQLRHTDGEALFAIRGNPEVTQHFGQEPHRTADDTFTWMERRRVSFEQREDIVWCVTLKGEDKLIGGCVLWNFGTGLRCAEIGYELHPAYEKRGIMTEAASAVLTFGFTTLELHRIEATPFAGNTSSHRLLHRLGFIHEGTLRQRHLFRGQFLDQMYFGLLKDEWLKSV